MRRSGLLFCVAVAGLLLPGAGRAQAPAGPPGSDLWHPLLTWRRPTPVKVSAGRDPSVEINRKLASIIIPHVEFRDTTVGDAVEFLRQESRRLDEEEDADTRGVNILLARAPGPTPDPAKTRITLTLSRIPLVEALRYVAAQATLRVRIEPYAALLVPLSDESEKQVTAVFTVKPEFFNLKPDAASP